jgi:NitT/TauT family transport system substrate-binding protein
MGVVGAEGLDVRALDAFMAAYARAVEDINANPRNYREAYLDMLTAEDDAGVAPDLFEDVDMDELRDDIHVPKYEIPDLADRDDLAGHLDWMKRRELIDVDADIDAIVAPVR